MFILHRVFILGIIPLSVLINLFLCLFKLAEVQNILQKLMRPSHLKHLNDIHLKYFVDEKSLEQQFRKSLRRKNIWNALLMTSVLVQIMVLSVRPQCTKAVSMCPIKVLPRRPRRHTVLAVCQFCMVTQYMHTNKIL